MSRKGGKQTLAGLNDNPSKMSFIGPAAHSADVALLAGIRLTSIGIACRVPAILRSLKQL
jgi:hypothetical protein